MAFHWPRLDRDQLLSVRLLDVPACQWSGGFCIEDVGSFHVTVRDESGRAHFVRVEIGLTGATYSVILTDTNNFPPPFRYSVMKGRIRDLISKIDWFCAALKRHLTC